jgi:ribosomal-protein-alanine N-acetyltransferase
MDGRKDAMTDFVLRTPRLRLRHLVPDDAQSLFDLDADPEVRRFLPDPAPPSLEAARQHLVEYQQVYRDDGFARWAVVEDATGEWLGWCGLRRESEDEVDIGYRFRRSAWGRGFATEGARASLAYGFDVLRLARIVATAHVDNAKSIRVLAKIGLRFETKTTYAGLPAERWALARDEWIAGVQSRG